MSELIRPLVKKICEICMYDLSSNCDMESHTDYVIYRLLGGGKSEEEWYMSFCK